MVKSLLPAPTNAKEQADYVRQLWAAGEHDRYKLRVAAGMKNVREVDNALNWGPMRRDQIKPR